MIFGKVLGKNKFVIFVFVSFLIVVCLHRKDNNAKDNVRVMVDFRIRTSPSRSRRAFLVLFTTFADLPAIRRINRNTLANWAAHAPDVLPVLFLAPNSSRELNDAVLEAIRIGWLVLRTPRLLHGKPVLKDMFRIAERKAADVAASFVGYANGDILFDAGLIPTLRTAARFDSPRGVLVIGRRAEVNASLSTDQVTCPGCLSRIRRDVGRFLGAGQDYFFAVPGRFPWQRIPDFVIGRPAYDNWIVVKAVHWRYDVIDASDTLLAVHQVGGDRPLSVSGTMHNFRLAAGVQLDKGDCSYAPWQTEFSRCDSGVNGTCQLKIKRRLRT